MTQSPSTLADHDSLAFPQSVYKQAASSPIKMIPYTEQRYLVQKPTSKSPLMKEIDEIKINNINSSVKRPKKKKCKKQKDFKTDKLVVEKQKKSTIQSDKDLLKIAMRKLDSVVGTKFDRNYTVPVELTQTQSAYSSNVNDSDGVQDKHGHVDFQENNTSIKAHSPVLNNLINSIEDNTTKQESDYLKKQNSQLTTNTTDRIVFSTKNFKPTNGNDTESIPFVFKIHNEEVIPTRRDNPISTTIKTSEIHKYSTTPSYYDSATSKNDINRETYNELEIPLQKIITKELTNGSVISYINGTEDILNNKFINADSSDDDIFSRSNITEYKNDKPPQLLTNTTKSETRKTPIAATFNFIFISIHTTLEELSDGKIIS